LEPLRKVRLYTDGACSGNPGPGGWGAILECEGHEKELSGGEANTTNNRMELLGVINGLTALKYRCDVTLISDSKYVIDAITKGWARKWRANGWMRNNKDKALNPDLWEQLLNQIDRHEMHYQWVKGHAGHPQNERCDQMAVAESKKFMR
jgi:ribonuclease HI